MGWTGTEDDRRYLPEYRIEERDAGFEPQMQYLVRGAERWYAILPSGIMADPNVWNFDSSGESFVRVVLPDRDMAERAILRAKTINGQNEIAVVGQQF